MDSLARRDPDGKNSYFLYSYIKPFDIKRRVPPKPSVNFHHRVDRIRFNPERTMRDMDVFHTSSYDIAPPGRAKLVTTVHDVIPLIFPRGYSDDYLAGLERSLRNVIGLSSVVVADSINTKNDIQRRFPDINKAIDVVYPGREESFCPVEKSKAFEFLRKKYPIERDFVLFIGGSDPRKNLSSLIRAFRSLKERGVIPHILVIVGNKTREAEETLAALRGKTAVDDILFTGYVDRKDINLFYSACSVFVYPSLYEGFGLPILEAFSCGAPVVTSSTSSCGEIASDAAIKIEPSDPEAIAEAIRMVITDGELASDLREKGALRARDFSWERSASRFLEIFEKAAST